MSEEKVVSQNGRKRVAEPDADDATGKCSSVDVRRADNGGFIARCSYPPKKGSKRGGSGAYPNEYVEPQELVFETSEALFKHLKKVL